VRSFERDFKDVLRGLRRDGKRAMNRSARPAIAGRSSQSITLSRARAALKQPRIPRGDTWTSHRSFAISSQRHGASTRTHFYPLIILLHAMRPRLNIHSSVPYWIRAVAWIAVTALSERT